jgi:molybdopterin/thiamine biosynthesis adenylyltransferase
MTFSDDEVDRYARHLVLREVGGPGQQKLKAARVLLVGAGGIGSPAALYLAAAGIERIGLLDMDEVALSNLQRQVLFDGGDLGRPKVEAGARRLKALNPNVEVAPLAQRLDAANARDLIADWDVVLDGTDDFATRYAVNAACVALGKPLVTAALGRWTGQVGVFHGRPCWRCLVPEAPPEAETCARVGVVGALAGVMGSMAALEVVKLVTGAGRGLDGRLLIYDGLNAEVRVARVAPDPACGVCGDVKPA